MLCGQQKASKHSFQHNHNKQTDNVADESPLTKPALAQYSTELKCCPHRDALCAHAYICGAGYKISAFAFIIWKLAYRKRKCRFVLIAVLLLLV